jgi:hypothetical protein
VSIASHRYTKVWAAAGLAAAFIVARDDLGDVGGSLIETSPHPSADPHHDAIMLGELRGARHVIRLFAGPHHARCSVYDTQGREIGAMLSIEQASRLIDDPVLRDRLSAVRSSDFLMQITDPDER